MAARLLLLHFLHRQYNRSGRGALLRLCDKNSRFRLAESKVIVIINHCFSILLEGMTGKYFSYEIPEEFRHEADKLRDFFLLNASPSPNPRFFRFLGLSGSGKTLHARQLEKDPRIEPPPILVGTDVVLEHLEQYRMDKPGSVNDAISKWRHLAKQICYYILDGLVEKRANIILDTVGASQEQANAIMTGLQNVKNSGYRLEFYHILCGQDTARSRLSRRKRWGGNGIMGDSITRQHQALEALLPFYRSLGDAFWEIDNTRARRAFGREDMMGNHLLR